MEHRSGLIVDTLVTPADGYGERDAGLVMVERRPGRHRLTVAADKGYDTKDFVAGLRSMTATPHLAQHTTGRRSAIDDRTTRHPGYAISQQKRKLVERGFGWMKTIGGLRGSCDTEAGRWSTGSSPSLRHLQHRTAAPVAASNGMNAGPPA